MKPKILLDEGAPAPHRDLPLNPYQRHIGRECKTLTRGPGGRLLCRWCGTETKPPRITFCSDVCVREWKLRTGGAYARALVFQRDKGVCACCRIDTVELARGVVVQWSGWFREWSKREGVGQGRLTDDELARWREERIRLREEREAALSKLAPAFRNALAAGRTELWDADHIVPVVDGGGQCGLSNYQTLCLGCHVAKSTGRAT